MKKPQVPTTIEALRREQIALEEKSQQLKEKMQALEAEHRKIHARLFEIAKELR